MPKGMPFSGSGSVSSTVPSSGAASAVGASDAACGPSSGMGTLPNCSRDSSTASMPSRKTSVEGAGTGAGASTPAASRAALATHRHRHSAADGARAAPAPLAGIRRCCRRRARVCRTPPITGHHWRRRRPRGRAEAPAGRRRPAADTPRPPPTSARLRAEWRTRGAGGDAGASALAARARARARAVRIRFFAFRRVFGIGGSPDPMRTIS